MEFISGKSTKTFENGTASKTAKLKIFQIIQKQYTILGISRVSNQVTDKRVRRGFLLFALLFISHFAYILHVANGFMEYVQGICAFFSSVIVFVCFTSKTFRKAKLFESIDNIEKIIDSSEPIFTFIFVDFDKFIDLSKCCRT